MHCVLFWQQDNGTLFTVWQECQPQELACAQAKEAQDAWEHKLEKAEKRALPEAHYAYTKRLRSAVAAAHTAGVDKQMIEHAEQRLKQSESLEFVVDVAAGIDAIESEGGTVSID